MIHPTAIISKTAKLGANVSVGPYALIDDNVILGDNCTIGAKAHIEFTQAGSCNFIGEGSLIGTAPQDKSYKNEPTLVKIGNNNTIREYVTIHRAAKPNGATIIGDTNYIMNMVHIAHDCVIGNKTILVNSIGMSGHCTVDDYAFISGFALLHQHSKVGRNALIGANTRVNKDVPPFVNATGDIMKIHGLNKVGMKRAGFSAERLKILEDLYRIFFREKLLMAEALKKIETTLPQNDDVKAFVDFVRNSKRGVER